MKIFYIGILGLSALVLLFLVSPYTIYSPEIHQINQQENSIENKYKIDRTFYSTKKPVTINNKYNDLYKVDHFDSEENYPHSPVTGYAGLNESSDRVFLEILDEIASIAKLTDGELTVVKQILESRLVEDELALSQVKLIVADANNIKLISTDPAQLGEEEVIKREELLAQVELETAKLQRNRKAFEDAITNSLPQDKVNTLSKAGINNLTIERNQEMSSLSKFVISRDIGLSDSQTRDINATLERYIATPVGDGAPFGLTFSDTTALRSSPEYTALTEPFATELMKILTPEQITALNN